LTIAAVFYATVEKKKLWSICFLLHLQPSLLRKNVRSFFSIVVLSKKMKVITYKKLAKKERNKQREKRFAVRAACILASSQSV
jgi:hypothetical protein